MITPGKGTVWPAEGRSFRDRDTGVEIRQLTDHQGHSYPPYFTTCVWYDRGRRLVFASERYNRANLYSLELATGEITQLTDLIQPGPPLETSFLFAAINPARPEICFWHGRDLVVQNLGTLEERRIYQVPEGFANNILGITADGRFICTGIHEDLSGRFPVDLLNGAVGLRDYCEAKPLSRILRIEIATGQAEVVFEENAFIGHVNTSPTLPHILTYCHEGPWNLVDHRIWGLDLATGRHWKIRPSAPGDRVGHEYWFADGEHIGYHGYSGGSPFFGSIRYDNADRRELHFPFGSHHFHSLDLNLIVGDNGPAKPNLSLWTLREGEFAGPKMLLRHGCSAHVQRLHVHPRISPDARQILYTSDSSGYANLYLADLPDLASLPDGP